MLHIPVLRTKRLTVQLRELSIGASAALAAMPAHNQEACCTAFLQRAIESVTGIADPALWTVQERMMAVCHYLAATVDDRIADFAAGDGRYSDYLEAAAQFPVEAVHLGEVGGDAWNMRQLTGAMAEAIERLHGEAGAPITGRLHWLLGGMAAQLTRDGENLPDTGGAFDEYLLGRMRVLAEFRESDFAALMDRYLSGRDKLHHLLRIEFADDGIVAMPKGGAASALPPARFPPHRCLSRVARELVGKPDEPGV